MTFARLAPAIVLLALQASGGDASRPNMWMQVAAMREAQPLWEAGTGAEARPLAEGQVKAASNKDKFTQLLPELARRAVMLHPSGAISMVLLDLAARAANVSVLSPLWGAGPVGALAQVGNQDDDDIAELMATAGWLVVVPAIFLAIALPFISILFVCSYKTRVADRRPKFPEPVPDEVSMDDTGDFNHSILSCCVPGSTCLFGLFCPCVRHADSLAATGLGGFWVTVITWVLIGMVADASGGGRLVQGLLLALVFAPSRWSLRAKFQAQDMKLRDCLCWALLPECSAAQEGLEVDSAQGVEVRCCCSLYDKTTGKLVGDAVRAER